MLDWLVITADRCAAGRGVRGYSLVWFLRTYFGRRRVAVVNPRELRQRPLAADTALVGLPSSLTAEEIARLLGPGRCRRVVPFDYLDVQQLNWSREQEPAFRAVSQVYLKPWFEAAWNYGLRMGMLPVRRFARLAAAIAADRAARRLLGPPAPRYDVAFLGQPNDTRVMSGDGPRLIDQRFDWLSEIARDGSDLRFWGGLMRGDPAVVARLKAEHGDFSHLYAPWGKVGFARYFQALRHSRVVLAPGGNAPWTYRHYEALYAGGVVVSIDFRQRDLLVPLPPEGIVHVPDGAPVMPAIRAALALREQRPEIGDEYFAHLERYLRFGVYSRRRGALAERFLAQLEPG